MREKVGSIDEAQAWAMFAAAELANGNCMDDVIRRADRAMAEWRKRFATTPRQTVSVEVPGCPAPELVAAVETATWTTVTDVRPGECTIRGPATIYPGTVAAEHHREELAKAWDAGWESGCHRDTRYTKEQCLARDPNPWKAKP